MLSSRLANARPLLTAAKAARPVVMAQQQQRYLSKADIEDPGMNGGYPVMPALKRQFRDPHADWWDKQERRNYGEPVHEDNDVLGVFSLYEYTHTTPGKGLFQIACFIATAIGMAKVVGLYYPDRPSAPREYVDGLEAELGGKGAVRARKAGDA